jgi:hypothetical protein
VHNAFPPCRSIIANSIAQNSAEANHSARKNTEKAKTETLDNARKKHYTDGIPQ